MLTDSLMKILHKHFVREIVLGSVPNEQMAEILQPCARYDDNIYLRETLVHYFGDASAAIRAGFHHLDAPAGIFFCHFKLYARRYRLCTERFRSANG